jgi:hypothetical protein
MRRSVSWHNFGASSIAPTHAPFAPRPNRPLRVIQRPYGQLGRDPSYIRLVSLDLRCYPGQSGAGPCLWVLLGPQESPGFGRTPPPTPRLIHAPGVRIVVEGSLFQGDLRDGKRHLRPGIDDCHFPSNFFGAARRF